MDRRSICVLFLLVVVLGVDSAAAHDYYVDCGRGAHRARNDGSRTVWDSLDPINTTVFAPGDRILLRRGTECVGSLHPQGSGAPDNPIRLTGFGVGPRPIIRARPSDDAAIRLTDQEHWVLENIETVGGVTYGIHVTGVENRKLHGFRITNVVVRDVTGTATNKESGLVVVSPGAAGTTFHDVVIDGVEAYNSTQWAGILVGGDDFGATPTSPRHTDVTVRNSLVHHVAGDGIVLYQVDHGLLEMNVAYETGLAPDRSVGTPNGIWTWMCHDCVVQYNEGYRTHSPGVDGGVYDIDYGCSDNIVQYNYAHDADGYCVSVFGAYWPTTNSIVRHNVCANNGQDPTKVFQGDIYLLTWGGGTIRGVEVYNNTVFWNPSANAYAIYADGWISAGPTEALIKNNIVVSTVPFMSRIGTHVDVEFDHNLYWYDGPDSVRWDLAGQTVSGLAEWQFHGYDYHGMFGDPKLRGRLLSEPGTPMHQFMLTAGSPAIDAGLVIPDNGIGTSTSSQSSFGLSPDIGAYEWRPGGPSATGDPAGGPPAQRGHPMIRGGMTILAFLFGSAVLLMAAVKAPPPVEHSAAPDTPEEQRLASALVMAFIETSGDDDTGANRGQALAIRSMQEQYERRGIRVMVVQSFRGPDSDGHRNVRHDWGLSDLTILPDPEGRLARAYSVEEYPTTLVFDDLGRTLAVWRGYSPPATVGPVLERIATAPDQG